MSAPTIPALLKAIHKKCKQCCCGQTSEIVECPIRDCALWGYRNTPIREEVKKAPVDLFQSTFDKIHKKT
jgi:hypothetical protein